MTDYIYSIEAKSVNKTFKKKNIKINALKNFNIKRIVYSNTNGNYTGQKCKDYSTTHISHGEKNRIKQERCQIVC